MKQYLLAIAIFLTLAVSFSLLSRDASCADCGLAMGCETNGTSNEMGVPASTSSDCAAARFTGGPEGATATSQDALSGDVIH